MTKPIDSTSERKDALKNVIQRLHNGETVEALKKQFGHVISGATAAEIAEAERALISEGTPVSEIQRLCDLHVAVFKDTLDEELPPESLPGHPVFTFRMENEVIMRLLETMQETLQAWQSGDHHKIKTLLNLTENLTTIEKHYSRKENILFPYLERLGFEGPSMVMWGVDNEIRSKIKQFREHLGDPNPDLNIAADQYKQMSQDIIEMIYKEEKILFPYALEKLSEQEWAEIRDQEDEIGYFEVKPEDTWQQEDETQPLTPEPVLAQSEALPENLISLSTGALTPEQIDLMLTNLPVDMTFVDEHDRVRYFSRGRERIFDRSPAIIGREVTKCHPPQSVHRVTMIIDDFRAGQRDAAEFWIQLGGKFIHIRYFALRDAEGNYKGTIEVSQDVTEIRALEGEHRLLDDAPGYEK